ncbi:MAG: hypothetical protein WA208_16780 [Thermoanaerobaculia bacterium]
MGHRTTRTPGRYKKGPQRPSTFFLIALLAGLLLLAWLFAMATARPVKPKPLGAFSAPVVVAPV